MGLLQFLLGNQLGIVFRGGNGQDQNLQDILQHIIDNDPNSYGPPPASKTAVKNLKKRDIKEFQTEKTECCVCLTRIGEFIKNLDTMTPLEREIIEMPCDHTFH